MREMFAVFDSRVNIPYVTVYFSETSSVSPTYEVRAVRREVVKRSVQSFVVDSRRELARDRQETCRRRSR